jgi:hypothetical protein
MVFLISCLVFLLSGGAYIIIGLLDNMCQFDRALVARAAIFGGALAILWPVILGLIGLLSVVNYYRRGEEDERAKDKEYV